LTLESRIYIASILTGRRIRKWPYNSK